MIENMARPCPPPGTITITITTIILLLVSLEPTIGAPDDEALLKFKGSLEIGNDALASWAAGSPPCSGDKGNWVGILCEKGNVWGLKLENMGLKGTVDIESLEGAPQLRTISLMGNDFEGPLPDVKRLGALKSLYLSRNRFSGEIPGDKFSSMLSLKKVHLAQNQLEGQIPWSLVELPRLMELRLEGNKFSGQIPNFHQKGLKSFNISNNNQLHGPIPSALAQIDPTSFSGLFSFLFFWVLVLFFNFVMCSKKQANCGLLRAGDDGLCGPPLNKSCNTQKMPSIASIVMVSIAVTAALLAIGAGIVILSRRNQSSPSIEDPAQNKSPGANDMDPAVGSRSPDRGSSHGSLGKRAGDNAKLSFVREDSERFDMSDLLKASAEILGRHQAVGQPALDWPARLKIVKGVAKGLRYLYTELPSLISAHGHLKSSNVLLKASNEPVLSDYGLIPVVNQEHAQELMVAYKSPEYSQQGRITKKTDVWSFGLLILEILTGKFPANFLHQGKGGDEEDLATWVKAIPEKDWSTQVFDKDMGPTKNCEAEMLKLLRIAMTCCESDFEKRLDLREAVDKIEELKEKDGDEDFYSSYASEADIRSSRGLSDELNFTL